MAFFFRSGDEVGAGAPSRVGALPWVFSPPPACEFAGFGSIAFAAAGMIAGSLPGPSQNDRAASLREIVQ